MIRILICCKTLFALIFPSLFLIGCGATTTYHFDKIYSHPAFNINSAKKPWSIKIQNEIVRAGDGAVRFELRPNDAYKGSRSELNEHTFRAPRGQDYWYGFSMFIPKDYPILESNTLVCGQWHTDTSSLYPPLSQTYHVNEQALHLLFIPARFWTANDGTKQYSKDRGMWKIENFKQGIWNDLIYNVKWTKTDNGYFNVWHNSINVIKYSGQTYYPGEKTGPYFKLGLYQIGAIPSTKSETHVIYFDEYRRGRSYEAVDPAQNDRVETSIQ